MIKHEDAKLLRRPDPSDIHDKPFLDFRKWPLEGAEALDKYTAAHPPEGQVSAVELLDGDDVPGAGARGRPTRSTRSRA